MLKIGDMVKYRRTDGLRVALIYEIKMRAGNGKPIYMIRYLEDGFQWGYKEEELECIDKFTAKENDLWLLDVSTIHSVKGNGEERIAYCFQSNDISFSYVIENMDKIFL